VCDLFSFFEFFFFVDNLTLDLVPCVGVQHGYFITQDKDKSLEKDCGRKKERRERERIGEKTPKKVFNSVEIKLIEEEKVNP
jgi:hypothetical protein